MKFLCIFFVFLFSMANLCAQEQRMSFELAYSGGNCHGCVWIAAEGRIVASTPDDFEKFIERGYPDADTIFFSSSGGDKEAALKLGVKIKQLRLNTSVGRTIIQTDSRFDYAERSRTMPLVLMPAYGLSLVATNDRHKQISSGLTVV